MNKFITILIIILCSCSQQTQNNNEMFIVPVVTKPEKDTTRGLPSPPPPISTYYLASNFIVDSSGNLFYHQQDEYGSRCGTGLSWDTPPEFKNLTPKDIIEVPINSIEEFIKLNILKIDISDRRVAIASFRDTFQSVSLSKIINIFKDTSNHIKWVLRKATPEESIVLMYKKNKRSYYSEDIKWDSSKTLFHSKESPIKFKTPRVEEE